MRLIDADKLARSMYEEAMIKDSDMQKWDSGCWIRYKLFENVLDAQPTIEPEQRWIPCDERLPEDDTLMLVNYIDERPDAMDIWIGWHEMENVWYIDGEEHSREHGNEVIAWMPLPAPYKGEK